MEWWNCELLRLDICFHLLVFFNSYNFISQVSATFAASFVISPALGAHLLENYSENFVVALATAVAAFDVLFILVAVPESLPEKFSANYHKSTQFSWEQADPFSVRL